MKKIIIKLLIIWITFFWIISCASSEERFNQTVYKTINNFILVDVTSFESSISMFYMNNKYYPSKKEILDKNFKKYFNLERIHKEKRCKINMIYSVNKELMEYKIEYCKLDSKTWI